MTFPIRLLVNILALACLMIVGASAARTAEDVDVTLVLAIDVSRSMSPDELEIQRQGYAAAIKHPEVVAAIRQGAYGRIAVAMFEWAADFSQNDVFGWTTIESAADAERVSEMIVSTPMAGRNRTSISGAINRGVQLLENAPYRGFRQVIDISGDGPNNQGQTVLAARELAVAKRVVINGLPLMTSGGPGFGFRLEALDEYYRDCVIGGPGSFLVPVTDWDQFPSAVRRKLIQEIGGVTPAGDLPVIRAQAAADPTDCEIGEKIWRQRQWMFDAR